MQGWAKLVPEFLVKDLQESLCFWRDLIGFVVVYDRLEQGFAYLDRNGVQIMLEQFDPGSGAWLTGSLERPLGRGINFQIDITSIQPVLDRLTKAGWPLFVAPEEARYRNGDVERGQRQFLVMDPDGYLLRFIEFIGVRDIHET